MTPLTAMSELRDIEDLVVDGDESASTSAQTPILPAGAAGVSRTGLAPASVAVHLPSAAGANGDDDDSKQKYKKRAPLLRRLAQSFAPSWAGSLPASLMGGGGSGRDDGLDAMEGGGVGGGGGKRGEGAGVRRRSAIGTGGIDAPIRGWSLSRSVCCRVWPPWCCCTRGSARSFPAVDVGTGRKKRTK